MQRLSILCIDMGAQVFIFHNEQHPSLIKAHFKRSRTVLEPNLDVCARYGRITARVAANDDISSLIM